MNDVMEYKGYIATVHYSADDDVFYGKITGINDLVTFEGKSVKELKAAFKEAADDYIQTCKELGKPTEKSYKGSFNVRVPSEIHRQAAAIAAQKKLSLNDFVKEALSYAIKHSKAI